MTVAPGNGNVNRQALIDLVVALVALPLLVVFGLLLESNMRGDWTVDAETRWHVLGLGLALLFISLLVMGYVTHRLGICIWQASQTDELLSGTRRQRTNGSRTSADSQLNLVVSGELPPSYESVVTFDSPPPYCSVLLFDDENGSNKTVQQQPKRILPQQPIKIQASEQQSKPLQVREQEQSLQHQSRQQQTSPVESKQCQETEEQQSKQPEQEQKPSNEPENDSSDSSSPKKTTG